MTTNATNTIDLVAIEKRLTAIENSIAEIKAHFRTDKKRGRWVDHVIGSITDEEAFLQALEYGRQYRKSDADDPSDKP